MLTAHPFRLNLLASLAIAILAAAPAVAQQPAASAASVPASEAREFFGTWTMSLQTPDGAVPVSFTIADEDGRVAVRFGGPQGQPLTDVSKNGEQLVARSQVTYQGMALPTVITVSRDGENLKTSWSFAEGAYVTESVATRQQ